MTPIHIPTKPYIKAWLDHTVPGGNIDRNNLIGCLVLGLLDKGQDRRGLQETSSYSAKATLYIGVDEKKRQGGWLNITQTHKFNKFVGGLIRKEVRTYILTYMHFNPVLNKAIEYAREQTQLSTEVLADDTIIKDFQRHRQKHGGPWIYSKVTA